MTFTKEELVDIAHDAFCDGVTIERDDLRYRFKVEPDDISSMEYINGMDALGRVAWPVSNRYTGSEERPPDFTGAARKFGPTPYHDTIWWEPYREGHKVYDSPEDVAFVRDLLDWGVVYISVVVTRTCECCDSQVGVLHETLGGIESPLCGDGNFDYLAECFDDLLPETIPPIPSKEYA
jgi:hypothetical protein